MMREKVLHWLNDDRVRILMLLALAVPCLTRFAFAQSSDEIALRALTEKFFSAYEKADLDGVMYLWDEKSTEFAVSKQNFQQYFVANKIEIKNLSIGKITLNGEKATVRVVVEITAQDIKT